jgi:hypothetical protein
MRQGMSLFFVMMLAVSICSADELNPCAPLPSHTAATAVREIANLFYAPFADYPFTPQGVCIEPGLLQVLINVYLRTDDNTAPVLESLCISGGAPGDLSIRWSLGPTPEASLMILAGENEDIVKSHDFWHIRIPTKMMCSEKIDLQELVFEREGGVDLHIDSYGEADGQNAASIFVHGVTLSANLPGSKIPAFLTQDVGIDSLMVSAQDEFTANFSAPLFDIPIAAVGDVGAGDPLSLDIFGIHFKIH